MEPRTVFHSSTNRFVEPVFLPKSYQHAWMTSFPGRLKIMDNNKPTLTVLIETTHYGWKTTRVITDAQGRQLASFSIAGMAQELFTGSSELQSTSVPLNHVYSIIFDYKYTYQNTLNLVFYLDAVFLDKDKDDALSDEYARKIFGD
jgi:hypothetical protein